MMSVENSMREKLNAALTPQTIEIVNESEMHAGHRTSPGTGDSHFRIKIVSEAFAGVSRVDRHRRINDIVAAELKGGVHALAIKALTPEEAERS